MALPANTELGVLSVLGNTLVVMESVLATRVCKRCKQTLPESSFYSKKTSECRECHKLSRREHWAANRERLMPERRAQYAANPEKYREEKRASTARNRDAVNARQRDWWAKHGAANQVARRLADPRGFKDTHLRSRYGITLDQYEAMVQRQGGLCAICHEAPDVLYVDHCHATEKIRGLLCNLCNVGIGSLRDDSLLAFRAAHYLIGEVGADGLTEQF